MSMMKKPVTRFMDMHSGGHLKTPYTHIYIDEPLGEAVRTFRDLFRHDPDNITCKCCGKDFFYEEYSSLEEATAHDRECLWSGKKYNLKTARISVDDYFGADKKVLLVCEP